MFSVTKNSGGKNVNSDQHLSGKETRIPYYREQKIVSDMLHAKKLSRKYNEVADEDYEAKRKILGELLNPACRDKQLIIIEQPFYTLFGYNLTVGENFFSNVDCYFEDTAPITIGNNCLIEPGVQIYTGTYPVDVIARRECESQCPVVIGNDVWIGGGSIVYPGVTIGDNVVIAARSVVAKDIPSNVLVGGNPAEIIRHLNIK